MGAAELAVLRRMHRSLSQAPSNPRVRRQLRQYNECWESHFAEGDRHATQLQRVWRGHRQRNDAAFLEYRDAKAQRMVFEGREAAALLLQCWARRLRAQRNIARLVAELYEKCFDEGSGHFFWYGPLLVGVGARVGR